MNIKKSFFISIIKEKRKNFQNVLLKNLQEVHQGFPGTLFGKHCLKVFDLKFLLEVFRKILSYSWSSPLNILLAFSWDLNCLKISLLSSYVMEDLKYLKNLHIEISEESFLFIIQNLHQCIARCCVFRPGKHMKAGWTTFSAIFNFFVHFSPFQWFKKMFVCSF